MWCWMFVASAERLGCHPAIWAYRRKGELVAHQGAMPVVLKVGNKNRTTGWFVETMTRESARGLPIGPMVVQKALEEMPFNISLGQTEYMRQLQYKLGWHRVGVLDQYTFIPSYGVDLSANLPWGLAYVVQYTLGALHRFRLRIARRRTDSYRVNAIERFEERHTTLWETMAPQVECGVVRDASYLNWKYLDRPDGEFKCYEVLQRDVCVGAFVLLTTDASETYLYRRGHIIDMICDPTKQADVRAILVCACDKLLEMGAKSVNVLIHQVLLERHLRQFGFISRGERHQLLIAIPDDEIDAKVLLDHENWFLTAGDSDVDRFLT